MVLSFFFLLLYIKQNSWCVSSRSRSRSSSASSRQINHISALGQGLCNVLGSLNLSQCQKTSSVIHSFRNHGCSFGFSFSTNNGSLFFLLSLFFFFLIESCFLFKKKREIQSLSLSSLFLSFLFSSSSSFFFFFYLHDEKL